MGVEYIAYRSIYEIKRKSGLLKKKFPTNCKTQNFITLEEWRNNAPPFFFEGKENLNINKRKTEKLKEEFEKYKSGELKFFNSKYYKIGKNYDWLTNPFTNYKYDINEHWTEIKDIDPKAGDIKYVWEKSRFSFLFMLIRYDYHFEVDNSKLIFNEINSWIDANPINMGPNYKCSQETSLRLLNWTFALYYYKNSQNLDELFFNKILNSIYWQLKHVYSNINFSRKTVRNNHAITETLMLYLGAVLFPFFKESEMWKAKGKKWFEEEINYQIYDDGTHLQFSMNYHRVVIQLLTWALILSKKNNMSFDSKVLKKAKLSFNFLTNNLNSSNGFLPNYGANDGALFFKLNNCEYRDYRPQINALSYAIDDTIIYDNGNSVEDIFWYGAKEYSKKRIELQKEREFKDGGYYTIRDENSFTFIRCGKYKDRPSHADNLHIDIWDDDKNILRDAGSYQYNTTEELIRFFNGTKSHNSVILGENDQMLKGSRFIWYYWSQAISAELSEKEDHFLFKGKIKAFQQLSKNIYHTRVVKKYKNLSKWEITDTVEHHLDLPIIQIWNPINNFLDNYKITAVDGRNIKIDFSKKQGWFSEFYGVKEETKQILFETNSNTIKTIIQKN